MEAFYISIQMDTILPAQRWRLRYSRLFIMRNLVSPMCSLKEVSTPQGEEMTQRVKEREKKRMALL